MDKRQARIFSIRGRNCAVQPYSRDHFFRVSAGSLDRQPISQKFGKSQKKKSDLTFIAFFCPKKRKRERERERERRGGGELKRRWIRRVGRVWEAFVHLPYNSKWYYLESSERNPEPRREKNPIFATTSFAYAIRSTINSNKIWIIRYPTSHI